MLQGQILLGIGFLLSGLLFFLLIWLLLRIVPRVRPPVRHPVEDIKANVQTHQDAVLLVESGGRIREISEMARGLFDLLPGEVPNIERMGRRVHPGYAFLEICAAEGQARFSINGKLVDAISYRLPGLSSSMLVAFRPATNSQSALVPSGQDGSAWSPDLGKSTSEPFEANLSLDETVRMILMDVERLVASDFIELKIWDAAAQSLTSFRLEGDAADARTLQQVKPSLFGEYASYLVANREELVIRDTRIFGLEKFDALSRSLPPMGAYIGIPLLESGQLVGTLEVGVLAVGGFGREDLQILRSISDRMAAALNKAILNEAQQRWNRHLLSIIQLSQEISQLRDLQSIFSSVISGVSPIFDVDMIGFLLYDEQRRVLEGQIPFHGLPEKVVEVYRTVVSPNSQLEKTILGQSVLSTPDFSHDENWAEMGLQIVALAASMRDTILVPLVSSGRFLGYLQISNHRDGRTSFHQDEMRLLNILAVQIAVIIDSVLLIRQNELRNERVETVRRITDLIGSPESLDDLLKDALREAGQLFRADVGSIFILDEGVGVMRAHIPSAFGVPDELVEPLSQINVKPSAFRMTVTGSKRSFVSGSLGKDRRVLPMYRQIVRRLNLESGIVVPLIVHGKGIGEMMLGTQKPDYFSRDDIKIAATIAGQLAVGIEHARHTGETDATLRRRSEYLTAMNRISRELNSTFDLKELIHIVYDACLQATGARCGSVILFEQKKSGTGNKAVLLHMGHSQAEHLSELNLQVVQSGETRIVSDLTVVSAPHEGIQSVLLSPIGHEDELFGLIELHSDLVNGFDELSLEMARNISVHAAQAIENTLRYIDQQSRTELFRRRADTLLQLFETSKNLRIDETLVSALGSIALGIQKSTPFNVVLVSLYDSKTDLLTRTVAVGLDDVTFAKMQAHQQHWSSVSQLMKSEFELGNLYFIPFDKAPIVPADIQFVTTMKSSDHKPNAWDPDDILMIPIYDNSQRPLGLISVDDPRDGLRPDRIALETLEIFSAQAALTITSGLNIQNYKSLIENLSNEVAREKNLVSFSQRSLPVLLHKDLEQTLSLSQIIQRARHIRASLQVTEAISRLVDSNAALLMLGQQILTGFEMAVTIVARETIDGPHIVHIFGNLPPGANPETSFGQRNPLRTCMQTGEVILSENLDEDKTWHDTPFLTNLLAKSFICLPVVINNKPIAAVLATDIRPMPVLSAEDHQVYNQVSKQVSIIIQNMSLLSETRQRLQEVNLLLDFSRHLSGLNPREILKSLLGSALRVVSLAHAGVVFQWEPREELLVPLAASNYADDESILGIHYHLGEGLPGRVFSEKRPRRIAEVNFVTDYNLPPESLLLYRKATGGRMPVSSMIVPILTGDRSLGALVLDNFNTPSAFRVEDEAILLSLTQQAALSLENVRLMQTTQERSGQLQALNAVAATLTSSLRMDELVSSLLERMATIIPFDIAILWLRQENNMVVADARGFDDNEERKGLVVAVADSILLGEMTLTGQAIVVDDVRSDQRFTSLVQPRYLSWMGIPLITKGQVIGVLAVEKTESHFFTDELMQLSATFASQAAVAIENAKLFEESMRRATELDQRSQRLAMLNNFSAELGASLSADQVLNLAANQLIVALQVDRAMLLLLDKDHHDYLLSVLPDEAGHPNIYRKLPSSAALNYLRESQTVYAVENIRSDASLASLADFLEDTASLIILPLTGNEKLYAVVLQSKTSRRFMSTEIELARTISNQAVIALENADLYQSTFATAERLAILNQVSYAIGSNLNAEDIYRAAHDAVVKLMPAEAFVIALENDIAGEIEGVYVMDMGQRITGVRMPRGQGLIGKIINTGQSILTLQPGEIESQGGEIVGGKGSPHSILAVPMISGGKVIGAISAQSYQYNAYSEDDQQILSTLANQVTVAILNARLFAETQKFAATLEQRVTERTAQLEHEQHNTETLLRILTEVTASLDLDRALNRTLALLNEAIGADQGMIMLLQSGDNKLHFRAGYDSRPDITSSVSEDISGPITLKIGEGLSGWVVKNRKSVVVNDLREDERWVAAAGSQNYRSALVVPLFVGEDIIGTIMVFHHVTAYFGNDALEMVKAIGSQVAIAINNAQLYELIRDQAERLGSMLRQQQVEASRQTAIFEAVADGVLVTDPSNHITFVNDSVERILDVNKEQMEDQSLENFAGLFSHTTQTWIRTVKEWSQNPSISLMGEMYAEQVNLDNGRVVLVHLTPVVWRNEFLGTVSILRDITHEVEVDRLKSEFVATVSHELRTPMTSIRGYVDLLMMGAAGAVNENQSHFLEIIKTNTQRLNILVNDLLDTSRIESGKVMLSFAPVDMRQVASDVVTDLQQRARKENKPMEVLLDATGSLPVVMADPERVRQILVNLVDNAYNYTPARGVIKVCLHQQNGDLQVDVKDSGIGISLEQHERVFERFYRGENPMVLATPGTGLGLSIVKQLVEMHRGKIWMDSTGIAGQGSTFSFTIPVPKTEE